MPPNATDVVKTLRSLLNSTQNGLVERQLWRDFREMEGYAVPFKEFGFRTFVDFLKSTNEFELINTQDGYHIRAKLTQESIHIAELVSAQNRVKKKKSARPTPFVPRRNIRLENWNHTAYSKAQSQPQFQPRFAFQPQPQQRAQVQVPTRFQAQPQSSNELPQQSRYVPQQPQIAAQYQFQAQAQVKNQARNLIQQQNIQAPAPVNRFPSNSPSATVTEIIDLTKSNISTEQKPKLVPSDDKWKHDRWNETPLPKNIKDDQQNPKKSEAELQQPITERKPVVQNTNLMVNIRNVTGQRNVNVTVKDESQENATKVSPLWLTENNESRKSVFERLGKMVKESGTKPRPNIQERLNIKTSPEPTTEITVEPKQSDTVDFVTMKNEPVQPVNEITAIADKISNEFLESLEKKNPKSALVMLCKQKNFGPPAFSTSITNFKKFEGLVTVNGMTYSTLPFDYAKQLDAEDAAARMALSDIKDCPVSRQTSFDIAQKIYNCIGDNGLFLKFLPSTFEQKYGTSLPEDWKSVIQTRSEMFTIVSQATNCDIIYRQLPKKQEIKPVEESQIMIEDMPRLTNLPWNDEWWMVDVTWVTSTIDIWGQLPNSEYLNKLNNDLAEIDGDLSREIYPKLCQNVIVGGIYATLSEIPSTDGSDTSKLAMYRIQVKEVDNDKKSAFCFYIDDGYEEWLSLDETELTHAKIYRIPRKLCEHPPQAIHFSLFNVEDFAEHPEAKIEVFNNLKDGQFMAKAKSTKSQYETQQEEGNVNATISVLFYDANEVNMNKKIFENICAKFQPPQLEPNRSNVVHVTYVNDIGDIYCRLHKSKDMHHIKQLIHQLTVSGVDDAKRVDASEMTLKTLRLVFDATDKRWYRAMILPSHMPRKNFAQCKFVDYGHIKYVPYEHIYRLSMSLTKYPPQTITVRLNGFHSTEFTAKVVDRLRAMLCCQKTVFMQTVTSTEIPMVNVWKRIDNILCKINESIRKEIEISTEEVSLPDSDDSLSSDEIVDAIGTYFPLHKKPNCNESYKVEVTMAFNPLQFFVRLTENKLQYENMLHSLWKECEKSDTILSMKDIKLKHFYAGRLGGGFWHRVKVQAILNNEMVVVEEWDSGDISHLSVDALQPLPSSYRQIPQFVFPARLHDIQPFRKVWDKDDCEYFNDLTVGKEFTAEIKGIQKEKGGNQTFIVELALISTANNNNEESDNNVSKMLVQQLRAKYK